MSPGHAAAELPLAMLLVFGAGKLLGELARTIRMPSIVGEVAAGVLLGPGVLALVKSSSVHELAELGVLFLLFRIGLEVRASDLTKVGKVPAAVAVLGVVVPLAAGYVIYCWSGASNIESLFVGTAMVATLVGIPAQVLAVLGVLNLLASRIILDAAVIDDVLGLLVLAVVSSVAQGEVNMLLLAITALLSIGFTVVVIRLGGKTAGSFFPRLEERMKGGESQFTLAMILLFALALLASYAGIAATIGAFLAGVALAETVNHRVHVLARGVTELLVPSFLAGIGWLRTRRMAAQICGGKANWLRHGAARRSWNGCPSN